ncbi:MAG: ABC transporter substrate-binding protein [Nitrospirae bacterium]|nr:MAG: ABC transporter substrate-binding protein [Nitrospirota bacterium]
MRGLAFVLTALVAFLLFPGRVQATEPLDVVRIGVDRVIGILKDPKLKGPERESERREAIRSAIKNIFDFSEMARRSLSRQWRKLDDSQRKEFVGLYRGLLERTYLKRIEAYKNERILYKGQRKRGKYAIVKTLVVTSKQTQIPVDYKLLKRQDGWVVYDVIIEGVSLINNYRRQFKSIIRKSSYEGLVRMLKEKNKES